MGGTLLLSNSGQVDPARQTPPPAAAGRVEEEEMGKTQGTDSAFSDFFMNQMIFLVFMKFL